MSAPESDQANPAPDERRRTLPLPHALTEFLRTESSSSAFLLLAIVAAVCWANSPWSSSYESFWHTDLAVGIGGYFVELDLRHWLNEGLMTLFFLVVGLEVKREIVDGELRQWRSALLPVAAAVGGMVVPAAIYLAINSNGPTRNGWAVPMATDVALALGLLAFLGSRVPASMRAFLLTLAIVDDIGAILVIAMFFTSDMNVTALLASLGLVAVMALMRRSGVRLTPIYFLLGLGIWLALIKSGVHATLAGVAIAMLTPVDQRGDPNTPAGKNSTAEKLQNQIHPWTSFCIVPLFALANAGVSVGALSRFDSQAVRLAAGVVAGLILGKIIGITAISCLVIKCGAGRLPTGARLDHIIGVSALAGIGFTVSLFFADLAFENAAHVEAAKIAVLVASILAAVLGAGLLLVANRYGRRDHSYSSPEL